MFSIEEIENALDYLFKTNAHLTRNEDLARTILNDGLLSGDCSGTLQSAKTYLKARGYQINN